MQQIAASIFLLLLAFSSVQSQGTYRFRHIGVENGLSQGSLYHIFKDSRGFLWLGSQDGVNRFDGKEVEVFLSGASGESTNVQGIAEDSTGNIYIGSHKGVYKYKRSTNRFTKIALDSSVLKGSIHVANDHHGKILLLAENGLFRLTNNEIKLLTPQLTYNRSQYNNFLTQTPDGDLWLLGHEQGLKRYSLSTRKVTDYFSEPNADAGGRKSAFACVAADKAGNIWLGRNSELMKLDRKTGTVKIYHPFTDGTNYNILDITEDINGKLWLATEQIGILIYDPVQAKTIQHIQHEDDEINSLKFNEVSKIFIDENNDVFVNTDPQGLDIITSVASSFSNYTYGKSPNYNLSAYSVRGLAEDENSDIWIGTELGGLNRLTPHSGKIVHYTVKDGLPENIVRFIHKDLSNRIWVATLNGFSLYNKSTNRFISFELPVFCEVTNLLSINAELLLLITNKGLMLFDTVKKKVIYHSHHGLVGGYASNIDEKTGAIYIANRYRGVDVFKYQNEKLILLNKSLLNYHVLHIHGGSEENSLWVATDRGLLKWNTQKNKIEKHWQVKDGLHHEYIYAIQEDLKGRLWLSTNRGLTQFDPKTERFNFIKEIPPREYNSRASLLTKNGDIYFGSTRGLDRIKPRLFNLRHDPVKVHLTKLTFDKSGPDAPSVSIDEQREVLLPYSDNSFTLKFTATDFRSAGLNRYRYFLKGYDKDTIYAGRIDQVKYARLPAGRYEFNVQASDLGGQWVSEVSKLEIVILTPFWQTWWFVLLILLVIIGLAYLVIRMYLDYKISKQTLKSEKRISLEKERSRIARDINDSVGSELFGLKLLGQVAIAQSDKEETNAYLQKMINTSKSISEQISEVIWLTDSDQDNAESLWSYIQKNAFIYLKPSGIQYEFDPLPDGYTSIISGEKRHDILNFHKVFFVELTKFLTASAFNMNFQISKSLLTITLKNVELSQLDSTVLHSLKKINGMIINANSNMHYIRIPLED